MAHDLRGVASRARAFEADAHQILGIHESSPSRVVLLDETYSRLTVLNLQQDELMRQALRCLESGLFRAAHVMSWCGFMDFYGAKISEDGLAKVRALRPAWKNANAIETLREYQTEQALLELAQGLNLASKNEMKAMLGLLNLRNQCAHPSSYNPDINATLGYFAQVLGHVTELAKRTL